VRDTRFPFALSQKLSGSSWECRRDDVFVEQIDSAHITKSLIEIYRENFPDRNKSIL